MTPAHLQPSFQDIEELALSARYGDLDDISIYIKTFSIEKGDEKGFLSKQDERGNTPLHMASANGHNDVIKMILDYISKEAISIENCEGNTPLHWASLNGHINCVKILIEHGANIKAQNKSGRSSLDEASDNQKEVIVDYLLEHGAIEVGDLPEEKGESESKLKESTLMELS